MVRIIMHGCNGYMGRVITDIVKADPDAEIVAGIDINTEANSGYPVFATPAECNVEADVIIDFTAAVAVDAVVAMAVERQLPIIICSTGLSEAQLENLKEASKHTAIFRSSNMSLGVNTLMRVLKDISPLLAEAGFDIEIVEKHHNRKLDAPSGTAISLAEAINESLNNEYEFVMDRSAKREKRGKKEIGLQAVRGGTIVGDHDIIFAGNDEVITISHRAYSRNIFAQGAVSAAKFLKGKPAGYYTMTDVIN